MRAHRRLAAILFAAVTALAGGTAVAGPAVAAKPSPTSLCKGGGTAEYHGTTASRNLVKAAIDPYKVANAPCDYPASVRGIRLEPGAVSLVAGGQLVRSVPITPDAQGAVTLTQVVDAVADPSWIAQTGTTVELKAALVQQPGTHLVISAPAVTLVHLDDLPSVSIVGDASIVDFTGVTVSSWEPTAGHVVRNPTRGRAFVVYKNGGQLNATGSVFRYLGSDVTSSYGVSWRLGTTGTVTTSTFEHNFFGVYTYMTRDILFERSTFRDNTYYGMDPHTTSSHLTIRGNDVYGNHDHGIVFSRFVTDSLVEGNTVHDNKVNGIMMDFRSNGNVIRNNTVTDNGQGIVFSGSSHNDVHDNTLSGNGVGVRASHDGADFNHVHANTISGGRVGVQLYGGARSAVVAHNRITGTSEYGAVIDAPHTTFTGNSISDTPVGMRVETLATVTGGSINARKTALDIDDDAFATVHGVKTSGGATPVRLAAAGVARLVGNAYQLPRAAGTASALDIAGACLVVFALLCELVHLTRRRGLRRVSWDLTPLPAGATPVGPGGATSVSRFIVARSAPALDQRSAPALGQRPAPGGALAAGPVNGVAFPAVPPTAKAPPAVVVKKSAFRTDIEGLRAVAVVAVVLAHASLGLRGGYVGVDVFFVISGFLITGQLLSEADRSGRFSFVAFYARRIRRILPAATLVTVVTLAAAAIWVPATRRAAVGWDGLWAAVFSVNWHLAAQATDYFHASAPPSPFQHYWSLSVEEQFYVVWPLIVAAVFLLVRRSGSRRLTLGAVLLVVIGASLTASVLVTRSNQPMAYFGTHTRAWELALGALVAVGAQRLSSLPRPVAVALGWGGLAAILTACVLYTSDTSYPSAAVVLPVAGAAAVIAAGTGGLARGGVHRALGLAPLRWIGRISFSLYLWHWPILIILPDALGHPLTVTQRIIACLLAVLLAAVTFDRVEEPVRHRRSLLRARRAFPLAGALIATSLACALALVASMVLVRPATATSTAAVSVAMQQGAQAPVGGASGASTEQAAAQQVAAAVSAAVGVTNLPTTITPSIADASTDFPNTQGCEVDIPTTAPKLPCDQFGDLSGTTDVTLIGDSHAGMWLSALDAVARARHWKLTVMTKSGCPVGDYTDYVNPTTHSTYSACNTWRTAVIARIAATHPSLVVIGSEARKVAEDEPDGMGRSVTALRATGARVVLLADSPSPHDTGDIPDCLAKHPTSVTSCATSRADALGRPGRSQEIASAKRAGAAVVDPTAWFCTARTCPPVIQNVVVYSDASHVTGTYGLLRAPELGTALDSALTAPSTS